jgi:hypothetical protein
MCYLQAEQRLFEPLQDWIRLLKCEKLFSVLKWFGRLFHSVVAANLKEHYLHIISVIG